MGLIQDAGTTTTGTTATGTTATGTTATAKIESSAGSATAA